MKMLSVSAIVLLIALASAKPEAPRFRNSYGPPSEAEAAPYPPSGYRPSGRQFFLPSRQSNFYVPPGEYGPPPSEEPTTTEQPTTTEVPTTTEQDGSDEFADGNGADPSRFGRERDGQSSGVYHILLPDGRLQRVTFSAAPNQPNGALTAYGAPAPSQGVNAGYIAQVQYQDVEPIRSPIYTFSAPLVRIFK